MLALKDWLIMLVLLQVCVLDMVIPMGHKRPFWFRKTAL